MTQTLTTKVLNDFITGQGYGVAPSAVEAMARELLANREAQPIYQIWDDGRWYDAEEHVWRETYDECCESQYRIVYTAPPSPAVPDELVEEHGTWKTQDVVFGWNACRAAMLAKPVSGGYKLPPHVFRELVNSLRDTAVKYSGTDQLRERLNTALSQFIEPDHPHTRTIAPEGGN